LAVAGLALVAGMAAAITPTQPASATCTSPYRVGAYSIQLRCYTTPLWTEREKNRFYVFAIRSDGRVMTIWQRYPNDPVWSGWQNLGGTAINGVWLYPYDDSEYPNGPEITVIGTDHNYWCNERYTTHWTGWHRCSIF
jgi:hypothetical protein